MPSMRFKMWGLSNNEIIVIIIIIIICLPRTQIEQMRYLGNNYSRCDSAEINGRETLKTKVRTQIHKIPNKTSKQNSYKNLENR